MTDKKKAEELNEGQLDQVTGGIGLLLPAVQKGEDPKEILSSGHGTNNAKPRTKNFGETTGDGPSTF